MTVIDIKSKIVELGIYIDGGVHKIFVCTLFYYYQISIFGYVEGVMLKVN